MGLVGFKILRLRTRGSFADIDPLNFRCLLTRRVYSKPQKVGNRIKDN